MNHKKLILSIFALLVIGKNARCLDIKPGDPVTNMISQLGEPSGIASRNGITYYMYDGGNITVKDNLIVSIPNDFESAALSNQKARIERVAFEASQRQKGLTLYDGKWVTPEQKNSLESLAKQRKAELSAKRIEEETYRRAQELEKKEKLLLISWNWHTEYGYAIAEGEVKNISAEPLKNVEALVRFYTDDKQFITSDDSLIKLNPILPGQASPFKVVTTYNPAMKRANIIFKYFMGGEIPFKSDTSK